MIRTSVNLLILFSCLCSAARGQSVGLVLSGGGAKGLYHIGAIKALEENQIPIDYITGTSIGAIVGGLYAIGYSPQQMEDVFLSTEIKYWLSGKIEDKYKYYFKQMNHSPESLTLRLDFKSKGSVAKIRSGFVQTNQLDMAFADFFSSATTYTGGDFDKLFVPFRCVATDATNRTERVFSHGNIGKAVRASMAIPFVFSPIVIDSAVMYDGGLFNNFPWSTMQSDFNPDIMIGCSVSNPNVSPDTATSITDQIMSVTMLHSDYNIPKDRSLMIEHHFDDVSTMDFSQVDYVIRKGYEDTMAAMDSIKAKVTRRVDGAEVAAKRRQFNDRLTPLIFESYNITGLSSNQQAYVRKMLKIKEGETFTFDQFRNEYFKILSEGEIEGQYPEVSLNERTGRYILTMPMSTKPSFKVMAGGNISSTALNQAFIGIEYKEIGSSARSYYVTGAISPFYTSFNPGLRIDFFIKSPLYFEAGFMTNYYNYFRSNYGFLSKGHDLTYLKSEDNYLTASLGLPVDRQSVLFLKGNMGAANYRYSHTASINEADTLERTRFMYLSAKLELERRSTNYNSYTTRGIYQSVSLGVVTGNEKYFPGTDGRSMSMASNRARHTWVGARFIREHYFPVKPTSWFSWGYLVDLTATTHRSFSNESSSNFTSAAFMPTAHSKIVYLKEFRSDSYFAVGIMPTFEFNENLYLKNSLYAFAPHDYNKTKEGIRQKVRYIFDTSLVLRTMAGPLSISLSKYDVSRNNWFITFNFGYPLFNQKGMFY